MVQYKVTGMSCAACSARVEKAVNSVEGVTACSVSLLTNSMGVEGTASAEKIIAAVTEAGYGASLKESGESEAASSVDAELATLEDTETPKLLRRLMFSLGFLLVLMYISMGHMMWGWPVPSFLSGNHVAMGLAELLLAGIIMVINQKFFISGFRSVLHGAPNMDTLVAMGSAVSFIWSVYLLFRMTAAQQAGDTAGCEELMMQLCFESAAMILTLITVGKTLEAHSKGRTTDALKSLMRLAPRTATVVRNGQEQTVPAEQVRIGDCFVVRPGESIPVDGMVLEGSGAVDESSLTGESIPVDKAAGDSVSAGTINRSGFLKCEASRVGADTALSQIIRMVSDAAATKAPIARLADKIAGIFVPAVISIAAVTFVVWILVGQTVGYSLARAISVLVISCPCSLGLATPVAIMVGNGVGARNGVLFKTAASLEAAGRIQIVALDKTGTVTEGKPRVTDILPAAGVTETELLRAAMSVEQYSEHPLAKAVMDEGTRRGISVPKAENFEALVGSGVRAVLNGEELLGGSGRLMDGKLSTETETQAQQLAEQGKTPLFFMRSGKLLGTVGVADVIKSDSCEAVRRLRELGIRTVMLTGDNERTAAAIGKEAGVDEVIAGVLPDGKEQVIRRLQEKGKVAMVGDGINDAPALTCADLGIAIGAGTDVAIDAADVVLMRSSLADAVLALRLGRATLRNIRENLFWAFFYNSIGIPIAAGALVHFGITLNPMFGAAAMSLSSFCVVSNALRLNFFRAERPAETVEKTEAAPEKTPVPQAEILPAQPEEENNMAIANTTMSIEGMMCPHCEARVNKALAAIEGVSVVRVSHNDNCAELYLEPGVTDEQLMKAVVDAGYEVKGVKRA